MLYVDGTTIRLTRGDTASLEVPIVSIAADGTETPYNMGATDELVLTVKKTVYDAVPVMQKELTGTNTFHIEPADTDECDFGDLVYDVQLRDSGGDVYTVIEPSTFEIMQEVT